MTMSPNIGGGSWIPTTEAFAARLALVRREMGWNLREASIECGLATNAWARYEEGNAPRNLIDVVEKISDRTGVDRYWLTFGTAATPPTPGGGQHFLFKEPAQPTGYTHGYEVCGAAAA